MKLKNIIKKLVAVLGISLIAGPILLGTLPPKQVNAGDVGSLNVWDGSAVGSDISGNTPSWPMTTTSVQCYPVLTQHTSAQDIIDKNKIPNDSTNNDSPFDAGRAAMKDANTVGPTPTGAMAATFNAAKDSTNTPNIITFDSSNSHDSPLCKRAGLLVQSGNSTTFYGTFLSSYHSGGIVGGYEYVDFTANVDPSQGTISFHETLADYRSKYDSHGNLAQPPKGIDYGPHKITNWSASIVSGGGAGGGGSDACPASHNMADVTTQAQSDNCVKFYSSSAYFEDQTTIIFAGAKFTAIQWGGSDDSKYVLSDTRGDPGWDKCGKSYIKFIWKMSSKNGGVGGSLSITSQTDFQRAMNGLGDGGSVNVEFHNINCHRSDPGYTSHFDVSTQDLNVVAATNPGDSPLTITTYFLDGGGNEKQVMGTYTQDKSTGNFVLTGSNAKCKDSSTASYFSLDQATGALDEGTLVSGTWNIDVDTGSGCKGTTPVNVRVMVGAKGKQAPDPTAGTGKTDQDKPSCEDKAGAMGWILCPIIDGLSDAVNGIYTSTIEPMMQAPVLSDGSSSGSKVHTAWATFRVFGNIFLVIVVLIVVFGESIGGGMLDAYTIKKVLPRLLAGAILINLSFYITALFIDLTNIIGNGIRLLIMGAFGLKGGSFDVSTVNGSAQAGFLGISAVGIGALIGAIDIPAIALAVVWFLFVALPMLLLLFLAIMAVLALRLGLIYALIMLSPVAFALWVLPNTEKYFKKWWELLQTTALVFPIVSALFGLSAVLAQATLWAGGSKGFVNGAISFIVSLIIVVMPLVLIPFAFKLAGGILGRAYEFASNARQRGNGWLKGRAEKRKERMAEGKYFNPKGKFGGSAFGNTINESLQRNALRGEAGAGSRFAFTRGQRRARANNLGTTQRTQNEIASDEAMKALAAYSGDEESVFASMAGDGSDEAARQYLRSKVDAATGNRIYSDQHVEEVVSRIRRAKSSMSKQTFALASAKALLTSGTVPEDANVTAMQWIHEATGGDRTAGINAMLKAAEHAKAAGRVDLFSSSPTENIKAYERVLGMSDPNDKDERKAITQTLLEQAAVSRSPGEMATAKGDAINRFAPLMVDKIAEQQTVVTRLPEYAAERQAKRDIDATGNNLKVAQATVAQAAQRLQNAQAQVTFGGTATAAQQSEIDIAIAAQQAADDGLASAQSQYTLSINAHKDAQKALEANENHRELMHQLARAQGMADIASQIPDGKAKAYVDKTFSTGTVVDIDANGNPVFGTLSSLINREDTTTNETFRQYHREYSDAQAQRSAAYQAAAGAVAGRPMGPPDPTVGP